MNFITEAIEQVLEYASGEKAAATCPVKATPVTPVKNEVCTGAGKGSSATAPRPETPSRRFLYAIATNTRPHVESPRKNIVYYDYAKANSCTCMSFEIVKGV